jgi:hypothetical protein
MLRASLLLRVPTCEFPQGSLGTRSSALEAEELLLVTPIDVSQPRVDGDDRAEVLANARALFE